MKLRYTVLLVLFVTGMLPAQNLISTTQLGYKTKAQLLTQFNNLPFIQYGAYFYRVTYTTHDTKGALDTVSALVAIPDNPAKVYPRLVYQHGTVGSKLDVPSFNVVQSGGEGTLGLLFAGLGYIALLPDYLGLGISDGFHPYVHAATEAGVALDLLRALPAFNAANNVHANDQLFITGYSQGGHAGMALHRAVELQTPGEFTVTAASHMSGPYSISGAMRNLILSDNVYYYPGYLPNTILSYQTAYGNIFNQLSEVFKEPYATKIAQYYAGTISLSTLNDQLVSLLLSNEGASRPLRMLQPAIIQEVSTNPDHPFNVALRDNDVYAWAPQAPTRLFYCMADDQVPFQNSVIARDTMLARGAKNLVAQDVNSNADHGTCFTPALTNTLLFFLGYQQIGNYTATGELALQPLQIQPNPASETALLRGLPANGRVQVYDMNGRLYLDEAPGTPDPLLQVGTLDQGLYLVRFLADGKAWQGKMVIQR